MYPLVSVIVPNYNNEAFVARCLDSLLNQTYPNIEIIFIDDCSTDRSVEIVDSYQQQHHQIRLIKNPVNMGVSVTRNIGINSAKGKYLTTLDSDDEYLPKKIEHEVIVLEDRDDFEDVAYSDLIVSYKDKDILLLPNIKSDDDVSKNILFRKGTIPRDVMFHRQKIEQLKYGFDRTLQKYEDWDFIIRILNGGKLLYSGEQGVVYNQHDNGLSRGSILNHMYWTSVVFMKNYKNTSWIKKLFGICCVFGNMFVYKLTLLR
jgi:glycosyltransferase involved in cell wall biosynthesis